jgi:hypothetical protein
MRRERWVVIVDGKLGDGFDGIMGELNFSPDSRRVAYAAKKGEVVGAG